MREWQSAVYWAVAGALIGFGGLALFSIGLPILFAGIVMAVFGMFKLWIEGAWAITLGLGGVPIMMASGFVGHGVTSSAPSFSADQVAVLAVFGAIALSGIVLRFLVCRRRFPG